MKNLRYIQPLLLILSVLCGMGISEPRSITKSSSLDSVTIALKWKHQFQFAGYYAAITQGFFKEEGLNVGLTTPENSVFPEEAVKNGTAEYGLGVSNLVIERINGNPIVVVASFFQHSPIALISRADKNLRFPSDFVGKKIMSNTTTSHEIKALFLKEGIDLQSIQFVPHAWSDTPIIDGSIDGAVNYITDCPLLLRLKGVEPRVLRAVDYGIDFYGDALFTSEKELNNNSKRVAAMRRASIKGWEYATTHVNEMIEYILTLPGVKENGWTKESLIYEAEQTIELIQPVLVELGHSNPDRWKKIADTYALLGLIPHDYTLEGFLYNPAENSTISGKVMRRVGVGVLCILAVFLVILIWNTRLKTLVSRQTEEINHSLREITRQKSILNAQFYATQEGILLVDGNGNIVSRNKRFLEIWRIPESMVDQGDDKAFLGYVTSLLIDPEEFTSLVNYLYDHRDISRTDRLELTENRTLVRFTTPITLDTGDYIGRIWFFREITELVQSEAKEKALTDQLHQSQKMEAVGQLAGGIAHDFNNSLGAIVGAAELLKIGGLTPEEQTEYLDMILTAGERAGELTKKLLLFSRKGNKASSVIDCAKIVDETASLLKHTINKNINVTVERRAIQSSIIGDDSLLQNAFMNMGINASHAMPNGGELTFTLENLALDAEYCEISPFDIKPGDYLEIAIRDTGTGMSPEIQSHIFEPFFTTKEAGKGTGLGLAAVYGTIQEHNGAISVYSEIGSGTVFRMYLPVTAETVKRVIDDEMILVGSGTILVIDDEELIRITASALLRSMGYRVILATNGLEGVSTFSEAKDEIDLIILDMIMPVMGGRETFTKLREIDPAIPVIIASGFAKEEDLTALKKDGVIGFLNKPFRRAELAELISTVVSKHIIASSSESLLKSGGSL